AFAERAKTKVFWLSRLQMQTAVYDATGARQDLLTLLESQPTATVELAVALGERQRLTAPLAAPRRPRRASRGPRAALAEGGPRQRRSGQCHPAGAARLDGLCDECPCRALDIAGGLGAGAYAVAD